MESSVEREIGSGAATPPESPPHRQGAAATMNTASGARWPHSGTVLSQCRLSRPGPPRGASRSGVARAERRGPQPAPAAARRAAAGRVRAELARRSAGMVSVCVNCYCFVSYNVPRPTAHRHRTRAAGAGGPSRVTEPTTTYRVGSSARCAWQGQRALHRSGRERALRARSLFGERLCVTGLNPTRDA